MPLTIRKFNATVKDPESGDLIPAGLLSSDALGAINTAKTDAVAAVQTQQTTSVNAVAAAGSDAVALFPQTYQATDTLAQDFASAYNSSNTYAVGDYCTYQYQLYRCNTAISTAEAWNSSHWDAVNVTNKLSALGPDTTLAVSGAAADAKVTGDKITEIETAFNGVLCFNNFNPALTANSYINESGAKETSSSGKYCRTTNLNSGYGPKTAVALNDSTYEMYVSFYDNTGSLNSGAGYLRRTGYTSGVVYFPDDAAVFGITFRRVDQAVLNMDTTDPDSDYSKIRAALYVFAPTDKTLSLENKAADAKITGDEIGELKTQITEVDDILTLSDSVAIPFSIINDYYIAVSDGDMKPSVSGNSATDYVDVSRYSKILYKQRTTTAESTSLGMAFYDSTKTFIISQAAIAGQAATGYMSELTELTVPQNAKYARFTAFVDTTTYGNFELYGTSILVDTVDSLTDKYLRKNHVDFAGSELTWEQGTISSSGVDETNTRNIRTSYISVSDYEKYRVAYTGIGTYNNKEYVAMVVQYKGNNGQSDFIKRSYIKDETGARNSKRLEAETTYVRFVLGFLAAQSQSMSTSRASDFAAQLYDDLNDDLSDVNNDISELQNQCSTIPQIQNDLISYGAFSPIDVSNYTLEPGGLHYSDGTEESSNYYYRTDYIDATTLPNVFAFTGPKTYNKNGTNITTICVVHEYTTNSTGTRKWKRRKLCTTYPYQRSSDCNYIRIAVGLDSSLGKSITQSIAYNIFKLGEISSYNANRMRNADTSLTKYPWRMANMQARMRQMASITYTTAALMPNQAGDYPSGSYRTGVPYSSVRALDTFVGLYVSLHTFATAVHNPRSVIYTRRSTNSNSGTYYGVVCSVLNDYFFGREFEWRAEDIQTYPEYEKRDLWEIMPGFILTNGEHIITVADVTRDKYGRVTKIGVIQAAPPTVAYNEYSWSEFLSQVYERGNYEIVEFVGVSDFGYEACQYVKGYPEETINLTYPDIMSEFGDKAVIISGQDVVINVLDSTGYTTINVYKGDTLVDTTTTLSDFTLENIEYGTWKVELTDGNDKVSSSEFLVVDVSGCSYDSETHVVTFGDTNATPIAVNVYGESGAFYNLHILSNAEISAGEYNVSSAISEAHPYVRVVYKTPWGKTAWRSYDLHLWETV